MTVKRLPTAALMVVLGLMAAPTTTFGAEWIVQRVTGAAFTLVDNRWVVLRDGDVLADPFTVRTLEGGSLNLGTTNSALAMGAEAAISVSTSGSRFDIELLAGAVSTYVEGEGRATVAAGNMEVAVANGATEVSLGAGGPQVQDISGQSDQSALGGAVPNENAADAANPPQAGDSSDGSGNGSGQAGSTDDQSTGPDERGKPID